MEDTLAIIATMTQSADFHAAYQHAVPLAQQYPNAVAAQIAAAYACDRVGDEEQALVYYRKGWALGVPEEHRFQFLIGFSSTLRNVGCAHESLEWLQLARAEQPNNPALAAFTALALHTVGETKLALATMLEAALKTGDGNGLAPYTRALTEYRDELLVAAGNPQQNSSIETDEPSTSA